MAKLAGHATLSASIGGVDYLSVIERVTIDLKNIGESVEGIADLDREQIIVSREWSGSAETTIDEDITPLIVTANSNDVEGSLSFNSGRVSVVGTILIMGATLEVGKKALQTCSFDFDGQGAATITAI